MNSKHTKILLKLINEEINSYLFEQDPAAPADPAASAPPADGDAEKAEENPEEKFGYKKIKVSLKKGIENND